MNALPAAPSTVRQQHLDVLDRACSSLDPTSARRVRSEVGRFLMWTQDKEDIDPLRPSQANLDAFRGTFDPPLVTNALWKVDHALRAFVNAGGALADEHGLGTGSDLKDLATTTDPGVAYVVNVLLEACPSPRDRSVYRSGLNKLARWARDHDADLMVLDLPDLEDFRAWLRAVATKSSRARTRKPGGEALVIARKFVRLASDPEVRRCAMRTRSRARASMKDDSTSMV